MNFDDLSQDVLQEVIRTLFPSQTNPTDLTKEHVWRDRRYLGEADGKVAAWKGWSANLSIIDEKYRTVFIDKVSNVLSVDEREALFGLHFAEAIADLEEFVVLLVLGFPLDAHDEILAHGFIPRVMNRVAHACIVVCLDEFLGHSAHHWAFKVVGLVHLQNRLSKPRKPRDI